MFFIRSIIYLLTAILFVVAVFRSIIGLSLLKLENSLGAVSNEFAPIDDVVNLVDQQTNPPDVISYIVDNIKFPDGIDRATFSALAFYLFPRRITLVDDCSSDIDSCCASHKPIYGADNIDKTYFRAENARSGNWWMIEIKDGIFGDCVVQTGTEEGKDILRHGVVESSKDGRYWREVAKIDAKTGRASFRIVNPVKCIRVRVTGKGRQPLVVREVKVRR